MEGNNNNEEEMMTLREMRAEARRRATEQDILVAFMTKVTELIKGVNNYVNNNGNGDQQQNAAKGNSLFSRLRHMKTEQFDGIAAMANPMLAENWLTKTEETFDMAEFTNEQKLKVAVYLLTMDAKHWWTSEVAMVPKDGPALTWTQFKTKFNDQYFPDSVKYRLEEEFSNLKQGDLTVSEYQSKFTSLSRFAPHLLASEDNKARRFMKGLHHSLLGRVTSFGLKTFAEVVEKAKLIESCDQTLAEMRADEGSSKQKNSQGPAFKKQKVHEQQN